MVTLHMRGLPCLEGSGNGLDALWVITGLSEVSFPQVDWKLPVFSPTRIVMVKPPGAAHWTRDTRWLVGNCRVKHQPKQILSIQALEETGKTTLQTKPESKWLCKMCWKKYLLHHWKLAGSKNAIIIFSFSLLKRNKGRARVKNFLIH